MSAPGSSALFAGRYTRREIERVRDYIKDQMFRENSSRAHKDSAWHGDKADTPRYRALQYELDVLETALTCLPLPQMLRLANDA